LIVDHRTYRIRPGQMQKHLSIYEQYGYAAQTRHLGKPHAYMFAETGAMNSLVHQWVYEDAADRARRRAAMMADPDWQVYLKKLVESELLVDQNTSLMIPTKFAPMTK
jgi:NIPSNAP